MREGRWKEEKTAGRGGKRKGGRKGKRRGEGGRQTYRS